MSFFMPYSSMQFSTDGGRKRALLIVNKHDLPANFKFRVFETQVHFRHCLSRRTRYHDCAVGR